MKKADLKESDVVVANNPDEAFWHRVVEGLEREQKDIENSAKANKVFLNAAKAELALAKGA